jgi:hypothetical protein
VSGSPYLDILDVTGTNPRQLNWWCLHGMVPGQPRTVGSGRHRRWTREQVRIVRALRTFSDAEISGSTLRHLADVLADVDDWSEPLDLALADHLVMTLDLPAIDARVPHFEEGT